MTLHMIGTRAYALSCGEVASWTISARSSGEQERDEFLRGQMLGGWCALAALAAVALVRLLLAR
jgi:hypothetical protein